MKPSRRFREETLRMSLPPRERGLKRGHGPNRRLPYLVAPPAGAWIETLPARQRQRSANGSLPPRERGLKPGILNDGFERYASLPPRERGLKRKIVSLVENDPRSLPPRERGLKLKVCLRLRDVVRVAPPAGAWIETSSRETLNTSVYRRSPRGSVD